MLNICRFCETTDETVNHNVQNYLSDIQLIAQINVSLLCLSLFLQKSSKLQNFFQINIHPNLPTKICSYCLNKLKDAISFRALCRHSEESLLASYLIEEPNSIDPGLFVEEFDLDPKVEEPVIVSYEEIEKFKQEFIENEEYEELEVLEEFPEVPEAPECEPEPEPVSLTRFVKPPRLPPRGRTKIDDVVRKCNQPLEGPYTCVPCNKTYQLKTSFFSHYRDTHDDSPRRFVCDLCGVSYKRRATLNDHKNSAHLHVKPFDCDVCGASFARKYAVRKHMECHAKDKRFKCKFCKKGFSFSIDVKRHETVHTGQYIVNF